MRSIPAVDRKKKYQTPYGEIELSRHVYQSSRGGRTVVPLEEGARVLGRSYTPRFAKIVSWKYSQMSERRVVEDMQEHHRRPMSRALVKRVSAVVAEVAQQREFEWSYDLPEFEEVISHISISRDGTTTPIRSEGYRETMCGTISFYTKQGDRLH